jgi:putative phage-type endonuclease
MQAQLVQGSNEWIALRKTKVTASDAAVIMGMNPWKTPYILWQEKLDLVPPTEINEAMQRGIDLEPIARDLFNLKMGMEFEPAVVFHENYDWMMASLDGISFLGSIVEIKCPGEKTHAIALNGKIPEYYYPQVQHQIACADTQFAYYFSFDGIDGVMVGIDRDQAFIDAYIPKAREFYECIINKTPPTLTEKDYIYRDDDIWTHTASKWRRIKDQISQYEDKEKELRDELIKMSGGANVMGNGIKLSKIYRKGNIDYSQIPEIQGIDVEKYRKSGVEFWKISEEKD